jgi:Rod binding domain-containing protein
MSIASGGGLPVVNEALEPAWVRHGSETVKETYQSAQAFEGMLIEQLTSSLGADGVGGESENESGTGGEEEGSSLHFGGGALSSMLPQALSQGVVDGGGLGLAAQLTQQMVGEMGAGATSTETTQAEGPAVSASGGASA